MWCFFGPNNKLLPSPSVPINIRPSFAGANKKRLLNELPKQSPKLLHSKSNGRVARTTATTATQSTVKMGGKRGAKREGQILEEV